MGCQRSHRKGIVCYWQVIDKMNILYFDKIKREFFHALALSVLSSGCTTWILSSMETTQGFCMLFLANPRSSTLQNNSSTVTCLPISQIIKVKRTGKDEVISQVLFQTPTRQLTSIVRPAKAYMHQFCADTGCHREDLIIFWLFSHLFFLLKKEKKKRIACKIVQEIIYIYIYIYIYISMFD